MAGPTRIRTRRLRVADDLSDSKTPAQISLAIPSSITEEDLQVFFLSRLREVIFGPNYAKHWYDDFASLGIGSLYSVSQRKTGVVGAGSLDGVNRQFQFPDKFVHSNGVSLDLFHNGRRLVETSVSSPQNGDFYCTESAGVGTGFDTVILLSFTPSTRSALVADYQVALLGDPMPQFSRFNALDQLLDIAGSPAQSGTRTLTDETGGLGAPVSGQTGVVATITAFAAGLLTLGGLTGMTANSVGRYMTLSGAANGGNNGTFLIAEFVSATSVKVADSAGVFPDANTGAITWTERGAYSLNDDLDFERSDRQAIKGVNYDQPVPTYVRPSATGTTLNKSLFNMYPLDQKLLNVNRIFYNAAVASTNTKITITSAGNLKHASATDQTGVPCFDVAPYVGDYTSCFVFLTSTADGSQMLVKAGPQVGQLIYGVTNNGASTSPNSVEVVFYSVPIGGNPATAGTAYTWEATQPVAINATYGYGQRGDQLDLNALRSAEALNITSDGDLRQDINDIQSTMGTTDGLTNLSTLLTNTGANFPFFLLGGGAADTVVAALNVLNQQIGNQTYTGGILTSGQTVTASLQALSTAISGSTVTRYIERLAAAVNANTSHLLPGGATYVLDGTNNGLNLAVFWRGLLRDPGTVVNGDDYSETDTTHVTPYAKINSGDHINFWVM